MDYFFELELSSIESLNYSETYFELDSEEATHCDHCHLITLKGMLRWSIQRNKAMLLYIVYGILFVDTVNMKIKARNALNAMFVETVDTVCTDVLVLHNTIYRVL